MELLENKHVFTTLSPLYKPANAGNVVLVVYEHSGLLPAFLYYNVHTNPTFTFVQSSCGSRQMKIWNTSPAKQQALSKMLDEWYLLTAFPFN